MALNFTTARASKPLFGSVSKTFLLIKNKHFLKLNPSLILSSEAYLKATAAQPEGTQGRVTEEEKEDSGMFSSARTQLDLLEQLTSASAASSTADGNYEINSCSAERGTIREQLAELAGDREDDFTIPLGKKNLKKFNPKFLTISQKRNIRRQAYLNEVSQRNDSVLFATIGAFVILPPVVILGIAILTGYVQLFP